MNSEGNVVNLQTLLLGKSIIKKRYKTQPSVTRVKRKMDSGDGFKCRPSRVAAADDDRQEEQEDVEAIVRIRLPSLKMTMRPDVENGTCVGTTETKGDESKKRRNGRRRKRESRGSGVGCLLQGPRCRA